MNTPKVIIHRLDHPRFRFQEEMRHRRRILWLKTALVIGAAATAGLSALAYQEDNDQRALIMAAESRE